MLLPCSSAAAEVCDKVRPEWSGETVSAVSDFLKDAVSPFVLLLVVLLVLSLMLKSSWIGIVGSLLGATFFAVTLVHYQTDRIYQAAIVEGCRTDPILLLAAIAAVTLGCLAGAFRARLIR